MPHDRATGLEDERPLMARGVRAALFASVAWFGVTAASAADLLLPMPSTVEVQKGGFPFAHATIAASDAGERAAGERLRSLLRESHIAAPAFSKSGAIRFHRDPVVAGDEAYRLTVTPHGADVSASSDAGLYYGAETLWQLIASAGPEKRIPAVTISDRPAFSWRGVMLDSARHMQPVAYIEQLIDRMAAAKLNVLHWHLTDDQGWRIEIDRYPRLTSVGAWRQEAGAAGFDPKTGKPVLYGGYYSKKQIREVVGYARAHHVTIVPEIDVPGHATAIIAAYPELASTPNPPKTPSHDWGILPNLLNPSDETFTFLDNVLDGVMALFPGPIHLGGDEAVKDQWKANPAIQAKIKALGLKDEDALQGWFTARVGAYLAQHGRRLVGWDEILGGQVPANATVMSWHGIDGAITAAKSGHDAVLAASPVLYLDHMQSASGDEPPGRAEIIDWKQFYGFDPAPAALTPAERSHILGLQANLWTEHVRTTDYADRMSWPKAAIVAELGWSNPKKDWPEFSHRLVAEMRRWGTMGAGYDVTPLEPLAAFSGTDGAVTATLQQPAAIGVLRYTTDGSRPTPRSTEYRQPLALKHGMVLSAQAFDGDTALGEPKRWTIGTELLRTRTASEMELCTNAIALRLEDDGPTAGKRLVHWVDVMHPCWIWRGAPLTGVKGIVAEVGQMPFNFAIGDDINKITFRRPANPAGELEVRRDSCDGPVIATVPLEAATHTSGDTEVAGAIVPQSGTHDLCMTFTEKTLDPYWVLDRLTLQ
jgi:hexosaminidase